MNRSSAFDSFLLRQPAISSICVIILSARQLFCSSNFRQDRASGFARPASYICIEDYDFVHDLFHSRSRVFLTHLPLSSISERSSHIPTNGSFANSVLFDLSLVQSVLYLTRRKAIKSTSSRRASGGSDLISRHSSCWFISGPRFLLTFESAWVFARSRNSLNLPIPLSFWTISAVLNSLSSQWMLNVFLSRVNNK